MGQLVLIRRAALAGVATVETRVRADSRGAFARLFCTRELAPIIGERDIVQINLSRTAQVGAVRGMHYQKPPEAEMKLVRCLRGRAWDVAVDLRAASPTFLHWHAEELSADNLRMLAIPEGCAHGFQVLEPDTEILYLHTAFYDPDVECGVRWDEPRLAIQWPIPVTLVSARDSAHALLTKDFEGIAV